MSGQPLLSTRSATPDLAKGVITDTGQLPQSTALSSNLSAQPNTNHGSEKAKAPLDGYLTERRQWFTTLKLLGFDAQRLCVGPYTGILVHADVFCQGHHHLKAAELVLKFFFDQLHPSQAREAFAGCYPACDPRQTREFRNVAFKWLEQLRKESAAPDSPHIALSTQTLPIIHPALTFPYTLPVRRTHLDECRGPRFESLLFYFSRHVLVTVLVRDFGWYSSYRRPAKCPDYSKPVTSHGSRSHGSTTQASSTLQGFLDAAVESRTSEADAVSRLVMAHINQEMHKFRTTLRVNAHVQHQWQITATQLARMYEAHSNRLAEVRAKRQSLQLTPLPASSEMAAIDANTNSHKDHNGKPWLPGIHDDHHAGITWSKATQQHEALLNQRVTATLALWAQVQQALRDFAQQQPVFDHLWEQQSRPAKLRAVNHPIDIPDALAGSWQRWLQREQITPYRASKLSLVDVVKMWRLATGATLHALGLSSTVSVDQQLTTSSPSSPSLPASPQTTSPSNTTTGYLPNQTPATGDRASLFEAIPQLPHPPQLTDFFENPTDVPSLPGADWDAYIEQEQQRLQQIRAFKAQLEQRRLQLLAKLSPPTQTSPLPHTTIEPSHIDSTIHCPSFFSNPTKSTLGPS